MNYNFLIPHFRLSDPLEYMFITQGFGENGTPFYAQLGWDGHPGNDLRSQIGTYVYASIDGVAQVFIDSGGGKGVRIHADPVEVDGEQWRVGVLNYHLDEQIVQHGSRVSRGQLIALTGNSGRYTTAPHDHFAVRPEILRNGRWEIHDKGNGYDGYVDPQLFLTYEKPMANNPYNLFQNTLVQLTEGKGGFGLWDGEKFRYDDLDIILASWNVRNGGDTKGKTAALTQQAWDAYTPKYDLKGQELT